MLGGDWTDGTMTDFKWRHFQGDVILWAERWYCRYPISYRELEEMLAERGISVDHTTIYRLVQCYSPGKIGRAPCRESVCQNVKMPVAAESVKKKTKTEPKIRKQKRSEKR